MVSTSRGGSRVVHAKNGTRWRDAKLQRDARRRRQRHPPSVSLSGRGGGRAGKGEGEKERRGGRGGVLPKRLKSGSGHQRLKNCGPSCGRHKIA